MILSDQSLKTDSYFWTEKVTGGKDEETDRDCGGITDFAGGRQGVNRRAEVGGGMALESSLRQRSISSTVL